MSEVKRKKAYLGFVSGIEVFLCGFSLLGVLEEWVSRHHIGLVDYSAVTATGEEGL